MLVWSMNAIPVAVAAWLKRPWMRLRRAAKQVLVGARDAAVQNNAPLLLAGAGNRRAS